jgi:hypothetical protein
MLPPPHARRCFPLLHLPVEDAELVKKNAAAKDKVWPAAQGPAAGGCAAQATGVATIDDVKDIRPVWRCEESDVGRGMGNIDRFMVTWRSASSRRTGSGCASPLVAEGRVFFKYWERKRRSASLRVS